MLPEGTDPADVLVVMEPTRNAWVPLAAWFRRKGARVVLVPPERSGDLRNYYSKHSRPARLTTTRQVADVAPRRPICRAGLGPGEALKRATKLHSTLTHRRSQSLARLDALLEILGRAWHAAIGADLANCTPLKFLAAGYADPQVVNGSADRGPRCAHRPDICHLRERCAAILRIALPARAAKAMALSGNTTRSAAPAWTDEYMSGRHDRDGSTALVKRSLLLGGEALAPAEAEGNRRIPVLGRSPS